MTTEGIPHKKRGPVPGAKRKPIVRMRFDGRGYEITFEGLVVGNYLCHADAMEKLRATAKENNAEIVIKQIPGKFSASKPRRAKGTE